MGNIFYTKERCKKIINSIALVIKNRDMNKLTKDAYLFCFLHMGFIAHGSHYGFIGVYSQLGIKRFTENLIAGEVGILQYNEDLANNFLNGGYLDQYSKEECDTIANTMLEIIKMAKKVYLDLP